MLRFDPLFKHAYYHADGNGNITMLINTQQLAVAKYSYDPFGNTLRSSGSAADLNSYRFSSKECDACSGMVYYLGRYYIPASQRWLNRDPLKEQGGLNLYAFVFNNPVSLWDFFGLCAPCVPNWATGPLGGFAGEDINYAARVIYAEASCSSSDDQLAVASVLRNRVGASGLSGGMQTTFKGVADAPGQFAAVQDNTPKFRNSSRERVGNLGEAECRCLNGAIDAAKTAAAWGGPDYRGPIYDFDEFRTAGGTTPPGWTRVGGNRYRNNPGINSRDDRR